MQYDAALRVEAAEAVESPLTDGVAGLERLAARMAQQRQRRGRRDAGRDFSFERSHAFALVGGNQRGTMLHTCAYAGGNHR